MTNSRMLNPWVGVVAILATAALPRQLDAHEPGASSQWMSMQGSSEMQKHMMTPDLMMPSMDAARGRKLFASKGCVVCHSVNGIGGTDGAPLDASNMAGMTNPFDFVANMWRGAEPMIALQEDELGGQVEFTGQELGDIIAFLHHEAEQKKFSNADIPPNIEAAMEKMEGEGEQNGGDQGEMGGMKMPSNSSGTGN
ncbi:MAG: c-type cytochrome [Pseudomonadota bacterium]